MSQTREELIKDIVAIMTEKPYMEPTINTAGVIADFILADRKRVVEPIRAAKEYRIKNGGSWVKGLRSNEAVDETLKNAGVEL